MEVQAFSRISINAQDAYISCPALSVVKFFVQHHINPSTAFSFFIKKFFSDTPLMRLIDLLKMLGVIGRASHHPLYNRQPGNPHCTSLLSSALASRSLTMISSISPNATPALTVPTLTCSPGSSVFLLPALSSVLSSSRHLSKVRDKFLSLSHAERLAGGSTCLYSYCFLTKLFLPKKKKVTFLP